MIIETLLRRSALVRIAIQNHPFNHELYTGRLAADKFDLYLRQDKHYLVVYAQALTVIANRFSVVEHAEKFQSMATDIVAFEQTMQSTYLKNRETSCLFFKPTVLHNKKILRVVDQYSAHLMDTAKHKSIEEALACVLPCLWIYKELGEQMDLTDTPKEHPYRDWIATYSDPQFVQTAEFVANTLKTACATNTCRFKEQSIISVFVKSAEYELAFFNAAYNRDNDFMPVDEAPLAMCAVS